MWPPQQLTKLWEATQVELHGSYSNKRVVELARYMRETSSLRAWTIVLISPFPCLLVTFTIDAIPLADPSEGVAANKAFFIRHFLCILMTTSMIIHQFRRGMHYLLPYPMKPFVRDSLLVSALTTGSLYGLSLTIGFPVPFSSLLIVPGWATLTLSAMAVQWVRRIRENPSTLAMLIGMGKLMVCDALLLFIYPPYYHIFTTLAENSQTAFTMLLPVIKLLMRNLFARAVRHLGDETPEVVVFNADAFGSLFVSYCMQSSPSMYSTIVIVVADALLIALCLRDILRCREGLEELEAQIDRGPIWKDCRALAAFKMLKPTTLERANILLEKTQPCHFTCLSSQVAKIPPLPTHQQRPGPKVSDLGSVRSVSKGSGGNSESIRSFGLLSRISRTSAAWLGRNIVFPEAPVQQGSSSALIRVRYMIKVQRLLYMAEFLLLLNYIEVAIPQNFAIYLIATYHLPNREYYAIFHNMTESQLYETLRKILVYWCLQLLSLLCLDMLLRRMLGLSPVRLVAFVLEKQVDFVQIHLTYWLCYNAQCTLKHLEASAGVVLETISPLESFTDLGSEKNNMRPQQWAKLWEATQVELQGSYSNKRVVELAKYTRETSLLRALVVVVASPLPSLLVTFLIDAIPLADPSEGVAANMAFFVRHFLCILMTTSMVIHQFRRGMHYILPYPTKPFVRDSIVVSALTTGSLYGLSLIIGFPVPFSSLVILPGWTTMTVAAMVVQWTSMIRERPSATVMLAGMAKLMVCEALLISVYPPYYHIFTTLTEKSQTAFTMLLPVIKLLMRNLFARAVRHLGDETPELSSPSIWSTMVIIVADVILITLSLRDIMRNREGLEELEQQINNGPIWRHCRGTLGFKLLGGRKPTTLERAGILLEREKTKNSPPANNLQAVVPLDPNQQQLQHVDTEVVASAAPRRDSAFLSNIPRISAAWVGQSAVYPAETTAARVQKPQPRAPITTKYTHKVRRLLYMAEFLLLLNYIEVAIPQNFAIYLIVTYHLPNREYYEVFHNMTESQLFETLYKLLVYWFLQLLSLLCLDILLRRILGLSPVRLLAFVLEKQVDFVQIHLTYWLCYNAQCTLKHIGYDYTFHFAWLFSK